MKLIKLKPLQLISDEILVCPPSFLSETFDYSITKGSSMALSTLEDLTSVLKSRRSNGRSLTKRPLLTEDKESVIKLSEFKARANEYIKSPLTKRYSFRKSISSLSVDYTFQQSQNLASESPTIADLLQTLTSREKVNIRTLETEMHRFTERNKEYESGLEIRIRLLQSKIMRIAEELGKNKKELNVFEENKAEIESKYYKELNSIATNETMQIVSMFMVNGKKKNNMEVCEEREYFKLKQKLRNSKRDLHGEYIESLEQNNEKIEKLKYTLEILHQNKISAQTELKEIQELLINFYCKTLKEGMDLREDGIRWCIKAIWKVSHPVPVSIFPKFIDEGSMKFLLKVSKIDLEIKNLQDKLITYRENMKKVRNSDSFQKSPKELMVIVKSRLRTLSQKSQAYSINQNESFREAGSLLDFSPEKYNEISRIKQNIKEKEMNINQMSTEEVKRVAESYKESNEGVGIMHIVKALVGDRIKDFKLQMQYKRSKNNKNFK